MGRILAIDYGRKRTGLAVSDPLRMIAGGLETVATAQLSAWLRHYLTLEEVECIIVGAPLLLDGSASETMTQYVLPFVRRLEKAYPAVQVTLVDERFTSKMAARAMVDGGMKKKDRRNKANTDKLSAVILLQGYLDGRTAGQM
ncbi:MAG: Holliday junction resolvase RuvX [Bacteroidales bacterium]|jgi:putative Holliday junction resolvase|nr:Holliday junction resolvase RuvX [Bacteroidales bacterium]